MSDVTAEGGSSSLPVDPPLPSPQPQPQPPSSSASATALGFLAIVLAVVGAVLVLGGIATALSIADLQRVDGTTRFRYLADVSSASVAAFALASIVLVVIERRRGTNGQVFDAAAVAVAFVVALACAVLSLNGVVVDLAQEGAPGLYRVGKVLQRLAPVVVAALTLWIGTTAPTRPGSPLPEAPPPSPPDVQDLESPA